MISTQKNNQNNNMENQPSTSTSNNISFANAVKQNVNLKQTISANKDQGIIVNPIDNAYIADYVRAFGQVVGPKNIIYASKFYNKIQIFLSKKEIVNDVMKNQEKFKIGETLISMRRLITPTQRIIISNVSPVVPHYVIENELKCLNLKLVSPVNSLRAGILDPEYSHVLSFRRHVFITPDEQNPPPSTMIIEFEDTKYRVFLSLDNMICYTCKEEGHLAINCPNNLNRITEEINTTNEINKNNEINISNTTDIANDENSKNKTNTNIDIDNVPNTNEDNTNNDTHLYQKKTNEQKTNEQKNEKTNTTKPKLTTEDSNVEKITEQEANNTISITTKRTRKLTNSLEDIIQEINALEENEKTIVENPPTLPNVENETNVPKKKPKKVRSESPNALQNLNTEELFQMEKKLQNEMESHPNKYLINYPTLKEFFENANGSTDQLKIAREFTTNIPRLLISLSDLYPFLETRHGKHRFTRLMTKIRHQMENELKMLFSENPIQSQKITKEENLSTSSSNDPNPMEL